MSVKTLVCSAVAAGMMLALLGAGQTPPAAVGAGPGGAPMGGRGGAGGRGGNIPATLGPVMTDMSRMYTALKAEATDETKTEQTLKDLAQFERDVAIAKTLPAPLDKIDDANKDKAPADYRAAMTKLQRTLLDLEDAVVAKKADDVKKLLQTLGDTEKAGHAEFRQ